MQTCLGTTVRKIGDIHRFYESKLKLFEGTLKHNLTTANKTFDDTKKSTELLSHDLAVVKEIAMMNKVQLEALTKEFNTHSCYRTQQAADITSSFFNSCSIVDYDDELDRQITETVRDIEQKRSKRKQTKRLIRRHNKNL